MAMEQLQAKGVSSTSEVGKVHAALFKRGQKINELEELTEEMANEATNYLCIARKLMIKAMN